ncbi:hypothetical protein BKA62DRAFT_672537 [Auriculariales sp. MPI-PUGE-AT-0066]|nr:hypothetical protein BKA62DRAFT_672537 [Auriculariales sp. MPI-PUGE-AT-0066]
MKPNSHESQWNVETLDETPSVVTFKLLTQDRQYLAVNQDGSKNPPITTSTDPENAAVIIAHRVLGNLPNSYTLGLSPTEFVTTFPPESRVGITGLIKASDLAGEDYNRVWQLIPVPLYTEQLETAAYAATTNAREDMDATRDGGVR